MYDGLYHVLPTTGRIGHVRPAPGEIVRHVDPHGHATDNWRLCCPGCGKRVHVFAAQVGDPEAPTFDRVLRCGCTARCGITFRITAGRAVEADAPEPDDADLRAVAATIPGLRPVPRIGYRK